jgi:TolB-like protein/Tfp pilus assembly protein PilF
MEPPRHRSPVVRFGLFECDVRSGELRKQGRKIRLEGQPVQILIKLLARPGELIPREELQQELWPADTHVNFEHSLNAAVKRLRQALGDSPSNPRFVETLARRGYRFIAPVTLTNAAISNETPMPRGIEWLAVLPFENVGADPETEYLSEGLTESVINGLSERLGLRVMARSTVFRYKDTSEDPRVVGRRLNVQAVLLGRVRQRGAAVVVDAELVDVENGWRLWGEQYCRQLDEIFGVEEEISREIAEKLHLRLSGELTARWTHRHAPSGEAYQNYLKGRYHWNRLTGDGLTKGIEYFQQAIQNDSNYAPAYAGLADCYNVMGFYGVAPAAEVMPKAKAAALRALEIDDGLAEAHTALASAIKVWDWEWAGAEREYRRALELNPHYALGCRAYAAHLCALGRTEEALQQIERAHEMEPMSLPISMEVAWNLYMARKYDRAIEQAVKTLEMEPRFSSAQHILGLAHEQKGQYEEAVAALQEALEPERHPATLAALGHVLALAGRRSEAEEMLDRLQKISRQSHVSPYWFALVHEGLGDNAASLEALKQAYAERDVWLVWSRVDPRLDGLKGEPGYEELLRRIGLMPDLSAKSAVR